MLSVTVFIAYTQSYTQKIVQLVSTIETFATKLNGVVDISNKSTESPVKIKNLSNKILYIDDDIFVARALARWLRFYQFEIDIAENDTQAREFVKNNLYAVIATDFRMPGVNGLELIADLRALQPHASYVLVSGDMDESLAQIAAEIYKVSAIMTKPWDADDIVPLLERSVRDYIQRCNQAPLL